MKYSNQFFETEISFEEKGDWKVSHHSAPSLPEEINNDKGTVTMLGYADIGSRIQEMLRNGNLDANNLLNSDDYQQTYDENGRPNISEDDLSFDETSDIGFDKIDALEKKDEIVSRIKESSGNLNKLSQEQKNIQTLKTSQTKSDASGEGSGETSPE